MMTSVKEWPKPVSDELVASQKAYLETLGGEVAKGLHLALGTARESTSAKAARVRELREKLGMSMQEAKRQVILADTLAAIDEAQNMDDVKQILRTIVEHWNMKS